MSITFPLTFPSLDDIDTCVWMPQDIVGVSQSPFTGIARVFDWGNQLWMFKCTLAAMNNVSAAVYQGFFRQLRGPYGTFYFADPTRRSPHGTISGSPLVNGGSQSGLSLIVDGAGAAQTVKAGDYFSLANNLYMSTTDATADGSGNITLDIWPELRGTPSDNAALTFTNPLGVFMVLQDPEFDMEEVIFSGAEFTICEVPQ